MQKNNIKSRIHKSIKKAPHQSNIKKISLFGSYAYGNPQKKSDIDILIEFKPRALIGLFEMVDLENYFSEVLQKKIDLRTPAGLSKYFRSNVLKKAQLIYESKS
jgi:uncharacterized protein